MPDNGIYLGSKKSHIISIILLFIKPSILGSYSPRS